MARKKESEITTDRNKKNLVIYFLTIIIIVILAGISIFYALGFFNPNCFGGCGQDCIAPAQFGCLQNSIFANGTMQIILQEYTNSPIYITAVGCNTGGTTTNMTVYKSPLYLPVGANTTISTSCYVNGSVFITQTKAFYKGIFIVNYIDEQGTKHTALIRISTIVQH